MASRVEYPLAILQAAMEVNRRQRAALVERLYAALDGLDGKVIGLLGLAFKPGTDDVREAPAFELIRLIVHRGGQVRAFDPKAMQNARRACTVEAPGRAASVTWCRAAEEVADGADALILATEWPEFATLDWGELHRKMRQPYLFDGRNFLDPEEMRRLGFKYVGIGRGIPDIPTDERQAIHLAPLLAGAAKDGEVGLAVARNVVDQRAGD